jgi:hypothetical protein
MSGDDQTQQQPTPTPADGAPSSEQAPHPQEVQHVRVGAEQGGQQIAPSVPPPANETITADTANSQQTTIQEVQHVRIGAGKGAGVRVQHLAGGVALNRPGKGTDAQQPQESGITIPRHALQTLRTAVNEGRTEEARATLDGWIGAVEAAQSVPPPAAEEAQTEDQEPKQ